MVRTKSELTTVCYLEKDDCYLMLHRVKKEKDINKDKWIGIGGHIEDGESPDECIVRETLEETGLTLNSYSLRGLITFVSDCYGVVYMFLYTSDDFSGVMNSQCNEGELEWIKKDKLFDLPLWEGDKVFFHLLETRKDFFSLKLVYSKDTLRQCILDGECINHKELCSNKLTLKAQECKD